MVKLYCKNCGQEVQEGSKFCNSCGSPISNNQINNKNRLNINKLKKKYLIPIPIIVIIVIIVSIIYFNNPVIAYENDIKSNKITEANKLYSDKILNNSSNKQKVSDFLKSEVSDIKQKFIDKKVSYDQAIKQLNNISQTNVIGEVSTTVDYINKLNDSRLAFTKGQDYEKSNDIANSLKSYEQVIKDDSNYTDASSKITNLTNKYKVQVLKDAENYCNNKDYQKAYDTINNALQILSNDNDLKAKKDVYNTQLINDMQNKQEVSVLSANVVSQSDNYKALYPDMLQSIIKNNTNKTIKNIKIGWLGFDSNNLPLKIQYQNNFGNANYEFTGIANDVNILSQQTYGDKKGWDLEENHGLAKVLACVKHVDYYDGSTWDNPYYQYWIDKYNDKPYSN